MSTIFDDIKARLSFRDAAKLVNAEVPSRDNVRFRSPLRPDKTPSCTIHQERMRDWSTGENFDAIDFYAKARGVDLPEAARQLASHLGIAANGAGRVIVDRFPAAPAAPATVPKPCPEPSGHAPAALSSFEEGEPDPEDFEAIVASRGWKDEAIAGLVLAHFVGALKFGVVCGLPCWVVTDEAKKIAEGRRLDGNQFPRVGDLGERKAHTVRGSSKTWPVGLSLKVSESRAQAVRRSPVVLLEGGPDLLAAYCVLANFPPGLSDVQPVAMLGTSASICAEALELMKGRQAVVLTHGDNAGRDAGARWAKQLQAVGCRVTIRRLPDSKDLSDLLINRPPAELAGLLQPPAPPTSTHDY